jgi:hypothetical protein
MKGWARCRQVTFGPNACIKLMQLFKCQTRRHGHPCRAITRSSAFFNVLQNRAAIMSSRAIIAFLNLAFHIITLNLYGLCVNAWTLRMNYPTSPGVDLTSTWVLFDLSIEENQPGETIRFCSLYWLARNGHPKRADSKTIWYTPSVSKYLSSLTFSCNFNHSSYSKNYANTIYFVCYMF